MSFSALDATALDRLAGTLDGWLTHPGERPDLAGLPHPSQALSDVRKTIDRPTAPLPYVYVVARHADHS
ncbi:MAG: hypothetical protein ACRDTA_05160 [Pseudonocardiaceae bacterium]